MLLILNRLQILIIIQIITRLMICRHNHLRTSSVTETNNVALSANVTPSHSSMSHDVLLSTALIKLHDRNGREHVVRAVLDSGSTSCFVTERLCRQLNLETRQIDRSIFGINNVTSHVGKTCRINMTSLNKSFSTELYCFVLPSITSDVPCREVNLSTLNIPSHIRLADPSFYKPADVDILIGADVFWDLLGSQRIKLGTGKPILCETRLGWIVSGPISRNYVALLSSNIKCNFTKINYCSDEFDKIRSDLTRFWQLDEVRLIREEVTKLLASAGMPLRKWKSNEPQLLTEVDKSWLNLNIGSSEPDKLLGLGWYASSDELVFSIGSTLSCNSNTKRDLLSVIARIFDPLGLLSPFVITMKMLLQRMWLDKLSWDEPLTPGINLQWQTIIKTLSTLHEVRIPRIVVCHSYKELELHIFTDASERAYGASVYVRSVNDAGECIVRLLMAKSRVAPIKPTTIPRLELCGAVVGARLYEKVLNSLRLHLYAIALLKF